MRLVLAGTPDVAVPTLQALLASRHEVAAVVTRPDAPTGRGRRLTPSPVALAAEAAGLEVLKPVRPNDGALAERLRSIAPDACPVVAYGALLGDELLAIPPLGWINLHFSLLPRWRGAAPVQRSIIAGDEVTGTTCFRIVKELDAGDVILSEEVPMPDTTAGELLESLAESGARQMLEALDALEAGEPLQPQPEEGVTYAAKLSPADVRLDLTADATSLRNLIMGASPDPGAWCELDGERFKVYRAAVADDRGLEPGEIEVTKREAFVGTGRGSLELLEVQAPGKKRMSAIDWARGGTSGKRLA